MPDSSPITASPVDLGKGITLKAGTKQHVQVINPKPAQAAPASSGGGPRPSFGNQVVPAGAPQILDFTQTEIVLKDLPEEDFRATLAKILEEVDDLGLNRTYGEGEPRAQAYLDMVTWDAHYRASFANDSTEGTSSCGMFVRNVLWLAGARGTPLLDEAYTGGILDELLAFDANARKSWGGGGGHTFNGKTFFPKKGDILYLYDGALNQKHIFTIRSIDKEIVDEDGVATVYDSPGQRAQVITFDSVDGGQLDGTGKDGKGKDGIKWGCQAIKKQSRSLKLNDGQFPKLGSRWPFPDGRKAGRPLHSWVSLYAAKDKFTAPLILPVRKSRPSGASSAGGGSSGGGAAKPASASAPQPHADNSEQSQRDRWDDFVKENQGKSMPDLLNVLASSGYKEVLDMRNWYASPENPKKEAFGLRPRVAMDAILHRNEGPGAGWILSECELASISETRCSDQYAAIKQTIGINAAGSGNIA